MDSMIPESLRTEHEHLHAELTRATKEGGRVAQAAGAVVKVLHPHFLREEEFALPPLGLLTVLAKGEVPQDVQGVLRMTSQLKRDIAFMLDEHKAIVVQLKGLILASREEGKTEYVDFAERLMLHARTEEEVLYPAAILIGEYLRPRAEGEVVIAAGEVLPAARP